jgi:hypothetical protein
LLLACNRDKAAPTPSDPALMSAADFCRLVLGAPERHLASRCSPEDKKHSEYQRLAALSTRPVPACIAALEPGVTAGRLKLHRAAAEACAREIESAPWKSSLRTRDLASYKGCTGLVTGAQVEGAACRVSLECAPGFSCAGASFESDGTCRKRGAAGQPCEAPLLFLFDETSASCAAGHACDFGSFRPAYALGYPPRLSAELEHELGKRRVAALAPTPSGARDRALADAAEFGMIGLLGSGAPDAGARGEGIGLGDIGTMGPGSGFGSGHGRLGSGARNPPRVRMGATSVSGRLPPEVIQRIVRQNFGRFRLCYENGLRKDPKLEGRVSVSFVIGRDGSVSNVKGGGDLADRAVADCVTRAFHGLSFPQPEGGIVTVTYPIMFSPGDVPPASTADAGAPVTDAGPSPTPSAAPDARVEKAGSPLVCAALAARGGACAASHQCQGGLVCRVGRCEAPGGADEACESDIECKDELYCGAAVDASGARGICKPLAPAGAPCTDSGACRGVCGSDGKCVALCGAG